VNFCSGVLSPKSINLLAKVGYNLAEVKPFGKTSYDLAKVKQFGKTLIQSGKTLIQSGKTLYNLAKVGSFAKLYRVLPKSIGVSPNSV